MAMHDKKSGILLTDKKDVVLVKPSETTPSEVLSLSTLDNLHNPEMMTKTLYVYRGRLVSENSQNYELDPVLVLKEALSKALVYYYPLAGKLRMHCGRLQLTCTGDGVPFLEATANCHLSCFSFFDGVDQLQSSRQLALDWPSDSEYGSYPLLLQVTKFSCGGFTFGMTLSHCVADGCGAGMFFRALAELAGGKGEPTVKPVWKREILLAVVGDPSDQDEDVDQSIHHQIVVPEDIRLGIFDVDHECIRKLKMHIQDEEEIFTTAEVLSAYIWRSRYRALTQIVSPDARDINNKAMLHLATGIRNSITPPLPDGYYGNAWISAKVELLGRDLDNGSLSRVAKLIKESKKAAAKNEQISKSLNQIEKRLRAPPAAEDNGCGVGYESLILSDWRNLRLLEEDDFGWKSCVNFVPVPRTRFEYRNLCIFMNLPTINDAWSKGGVRVYLSLPAVAMQRFSEEMDALKSKDLHPNC